MFVLWGQNKSEKLKSFKSLIFYFLGVFVFDCAWHLFTPPAFSLNQGYSQCPLTPSSIQSTFARSLFPFTFFFFFFKSEVVGIYYKQIIQGWALQKLSFHLLYFHLNTNLKILHSTSLSLLFYIYFIFTLQVNYSNIVVQAKSRGVEFSNLQI